MYISGILGKKEDHCSHRKKSVGEKFSETTLYDFCGQGKDNFGGT